jgi:signal transduction histidine kinase
VAAAKQKEIEQGKKTMNQVQQNLDKAMEQTRQSTERADAAAK